MNKKILFRIIIPTICILTILSCFGIFYISSKKTPSSNSELRFDYGFRVKNFEVERFDNYAKLELKFVIEIDDNDSSLYSFKINNKLYYSYDENLSFDSIDNEKNIRLYKLTFEKKDIKWNALSYTLSEVSVLNTEKLTVKNIPDTFTASLNIDDLLYPDEALSKETLCNLDTSKGVFLRFYNPFEFDFEPRYSLSKGLEFERKEQAGLYTYFYFKVNPDKVELNDLNDSNLILKIDGYNFSENIHLKESQYSILYHKYDPTIKNISEEVFLDKNKNIYITFSDSKVPSKIYLSINNEETLIKNVIDNNFITLDELEMGINKINFTAFLYQVNDESYYIRLEENQYIYNIDCKYSPLKLTLNELKDKDTLEGEKNEISFNLEGAGSLKSLLVFNNGKETTFSSEDIKKKDGIYSIELNLYNDFSIKEINYYSDDEALITQKVDCEFVNLSLREVPKRSNIIFDEFVFNKSISLQISYNDLKEKDIKTVKVNNKETVFSINKNILKVTTDKIAKPRISGILDFEVIYANEKTDNFEKEFVICSLYNLEKDNYIYCGDKIKIIVKVFQTKNPNINFSTLILEDFINITVTEETSFDERQKKLYNDEENYYFYVDSVTAKKVIVNEIFYEIDGQLYKEKIDLEIDV